MNSLSIITVVKNPGHEFLLTLDSIRKIEGLDMTSFEWIVVEHLEKYENSEISIMLNLENNILIRHYTGSDDGIFDAMNKGQQLVEKSHYMFINSGDTISRSVLQMIQPLSTNKVHCFNSNWHNLKGQAAFNRKHRIAPKIGLMPNHQAMVFPIQFKHQLYDTSYRIAADQDLKLKLFKSNQIEMMNVEISSCLEGGVSARSLRVHEVFRRTVETARVLTKNFGKLQGLAFTVLYFVAYARRVTFIIKMK